MSISSYTVFHPAHTVPKSLGKPAGGIDPWWVTHLSPPALQVMQLATAPDTLPTFPLVLCTQDILTPSEIQAILTDTPDPRNTKHADICFCSTIQSF